MTKWIAFAAARSSVKTTSGFWITSGYNRQSGLYTVTWPVAFDERNFIAVTRDGEHA
jgi:hypothetical protein